MGNHSNKCDEEDTLKTSNKNGSNFLVLKNDIHDSSSEDKMGVKYNGQILQSVQQAVQEEESDSKDELYIRRPK